MGIVFNLSTKIFFQTGVFFRGDFPSRVFVAHKKTDRWKDAEMLREVKNDGATYPRYYDDQSGRDVYLNEIIAH